MKVSFVGIIFCLGILRSSFCSWSYNHWKAKSSHEEEENDFEDKRVRRQASSQPMYEYVLYTHLLIQGFSIAEAESHLLNSTMMPYKISLNDTKSVNIENLQITTECNITNIGRSCVCKAGFQWNITTCYMYPTCAGYPFCSCLIVANRSVPFCELPCEPRNSTVALYGIFTLNQKYTSYLQDSSTSAYQTLENNITTALVFAYSGICSPLNVSISGFSNAGGITAYYQMLLGGPVTTSNLTASGTTAVQLLQNAINSTVTVAGVSSIEPQQLRVNVWSPILLTCTINETMDAVNWTLITNSSRDMIFSAGGNVLISTSYSPGMTTSTLSIARADQWSIGTYLCQFSREGLLYNATAQVNVSLLPSEIILNPVQLSFRSSAGNSVQLQCCAKIDGEVYGVTWTYNGTTVNASPGTQTDLQCYTLNAGVPSTDTNYNCTFSNSDGQTKSAIIPVTIIKDAEQFCPQTNTSDGIIWGITRAGLQATVYCAPGKSGTQTRNCSANGEWMEVQDNCISLILWEALNDAQALENGLGNLQEKVPAILTTISDPSAVSVNNPAGVTGLVSILGIISNVSANMDMAFGASVVTDFLAVASNLSDPSLSSLWKTSRSPAASNMMKSVEQFSTLLKADSHTFDIPLQNIQLKGSSYGNMSIIDDYAKTFDGVHGVSTFINKETIAAMLATDNFTVTSLVFNTIGDLLPNSTTGEFKGTQLNSVIQSTSIKSAGSTNLSGEIHMNFTTNFSGSNYGQHCAFWDFSQPSAGGGWSDQGCTTNVKDNMTICTCNHLTSFAVLMSINAEPLFLIDELTYAGLTASILSLCVCIITECLVWKSVVRNNISYFRHISLFNIAVSLLFADIFFFSATFPSVKNYKFICLAITFLNHFFYLALFFWTFCQSVMLLHQLLFVFHHLRKKIFVSLSLFVGYFIPALIATGTFLYFYPKQTYLHQSVCWLNPESGPIYTFAIPAGSIIMFNFMTLMVVISKLSRPSVSEAQRPEEKETAKSIMKAVLVLTPVFGLTWSFGFALLKDLDSITRQIFTYGFAGLNAFQGFFIFITCLTEKKVREALTNKVSSRPTSSTMSSMSKSEIPTKICTVSTISKDK
ncbi:adhesion G-protein coupled receptor F3 isoform X2 [Xenopus laevis]|uniref:Adhesion G-protein coupled receptor F3 isoform X2 n=1 Tax=Xenopus laevis TaxID=8355 RepID=A0A8J0VD07_XENLA|nr:adhesion G-protein coupled receptor F3 isoform X2 [Xenopus laevis]